MLNRLQAQAQLVKAFPEETPKAWTVYQDLYLFRVEHPSAAEKNWDPFFSVDHITGEVRDFSVLTDGNLSEIGALKWNNV